MPELVLSPLPRHAAVVPAWAVPNLLLAERLKRNSGASVTNPWVVERATLCVTEGHGMLAAAHLLRYGEGPEVAENLRGAGRFYRRFGWDVLAREIRSWSRETG